MLSSAAAAIVAFSASGLLGGGALATPPAQPHRLALTLNPAATIWTGEAPAEICAIGRSLRVSAAPTAGRSGGFRRSGEIVAEILAPASQAMLVTGTARACADLAASESSPAALLAGAAAPKFAERLTTCLRSAGAAGSVGRLMFSIDSGCDL